MLKSFVVDNVTVEFQGFDSDEDVITDAMAKAAVDYAEENKEVPVAVISKITVSKENDKTFFDVEYDDENQPKIGRIRRITGCEQIR